MAVNWQNVFTRIYRKELAVAARNAEKIPYTTDEAGRFDDWSERNVCWWTNGFWAGLLWQLYGVRENELFRKIARQIERKLDKNLMDAQGMDHDGGFKWLLTSGADYALTGAEESKNRLLLAACNLAGRQNPAGGYLRAWNDGGDGSQAGLAIVDCMMNLPLLYKAGELTGDPRFSQIAERHAETAQKYFVREDGSCAHIALFDPRTGKFQGTLAGQGMAVGSSWTRGQSWALYGFTLSALHAKRTDFSETAERVARNFIARMRKFGHMPVDFCQEEDCPYEDDSAAAIAACGLMELGRLTKKEEYFSAAEELLATLLKDRCDFSEERDNLLLRCSAAYHDERHNFALIYGDYFFTEAVLKMIDKETFLW